MALVAFDLVITVASAPWLLFPHRWPQGTPLLTCLLVLPRLTYVAARKWTAVRMPLRTPLDGPIVVLLAMVFVARFVSVEPQFSDHKFYGLLLGVSVFYSITQGAAAFAGRCWPGSTRSSSLHTAAGLFIAAGTGIALLGLVGVHWKGSRIPWLTDIYQMLPRLITEVQASTRTLPGLDANQLAGTLTLVLPMAIAAAVTGRRVAGPVVKKGSRSAVARSVAVTARSTSSHLQRPGHWALTAAAAWGLAALGAMLMTAVVILAQSRSAYVGAAAGLLLAAILTWEQGRRLLLVAAPVGLAGLWLWGPNRALDFVLAMDATAVGGGGTWESRSEVWLRAIYMMQDFPFTGIGLNTFPLVLDALYPAFLSGPDARIPHAHNLFLQTGVDLGLPGLMALLWMLGIVARCLRLAWGRDQVAMRPVVEGETQELVASSDANEAAAVRIIVAGVAAGLVAHGIYSMTDTVTLGAKPGVMLWWVLALAVIASRVARTGDGPTSPGLREPAETPA